MFGTGVEDAYTCDEWEAAPLRAAAGDPVQLPLWTEPAANEIIDVDALVATLRTKTDPVRVAVAETMMTPALEGVGLSFDVNNPLVDRMLAQSGSQITNIAETTQLNTMRVIRASYEQGLSIPDTATAIREGMKEASVARSTLIARTELVGVTNGASLAATHIVEDATGVGYNKTWLTAPGAQFPRHELYEGLDGQSVPLEGFFTVGDAEMQFPGDPAGPPDEVCNCWPAETLVEMPSLRATIRRWYDGDLVHVRLASGDVLAGTPNHPVLRADGVFVPLSALEEGDHLVSAVLARDESGTPDPDRRPAEIGETHRLAKVAGVAERIRLRPPDLHGAGADGEVEVVTIDGALLVDREAATDEQVAEFGLAFAAAARTASSGSADAFAMGHGFGRKIAWTAASGVCGAGERAALVLVHASQAQPVRVGPVANGQPEFVEASNDQGTAHAEFVGDAKDAVAAVVFLAEVVEVERNPFHGYVYNLDTGEGWYTAGSIVGANCRCTMAYDEDGEQVEVGAEEEGGGLAEGEGTAAEAEGEATDFADFPETADDAADSFVSGLERSQVEKGITPLPADLDAATANWTRQLDEAMVVDPAITASLQEADAYNRGSVIYQDALAKYGRDTVVVVSDDTPVGNLLNTSGAGQRLSGVRATVLNEKVFTGDLAYAPVAATEPGGGTVSGGIAGMIRHEYAHQIQDAMTPEVLTAFRQDLPAADVVRQDLSIYARKGLDVGNAQEAFSELFAVVSDPAYNPDLWAPWVRDLGAKYFDAPLVGPMTPLQADLFAIRSQAEWITPNEALTRLVASHETTDAAAQAAAQERYGVGLHGELPGYVRDQFQATLDAGARVEQELATERIAAEYGAKLETLSQQAVDLEAGRAARLAPFENAAARAEEKFAAYSERVNNRIAEELFGKPYADLTTDEIVAVGRKLVSADLPADIRETKLALYDADAAARGALAHERTAWLTDKQAVDQEMISLRGEQLKAEREDLLGVLSEVRPMGASADVDVSVFGKERGYKKATKALETALPYYPRSWIADMPIMQPATAARRGYLQVLGKTGPGATLGEGRVMSKIVLTDRPVVATGDNPATSVALHELGHAVEATRPDILSAEKAFYEYRTRGGSFTDTQESMQQMSKLRPGYGYKQGEVTREDKFSEPYMGKEYGGKYYELLTMGMEGLWSGTEVLDAEYRRWLLGLLALA
jgi:hypothetical protein